MGDTLPLSLILTMKTERLGEFSLLLQQGFAVPALVGCTLENLLELQWQLAPDYVAKRIATIFLDNRPIDDLATAIIRENCVVALSGAMPGLVGATMRRDGFYANLRSNITHREVIPDDPTQRIARIRVKIFNILLSELGPGFLRRGIILGLTELACFLENNTAACWQDCTKAVLDGVAVAPAQLSEKMQLSGSETVYLHVITN
ncbi:MAG: hypothetical protein Q8K46_03820 [Deltaproteobacteria bacterium]|nr:hypothetical protein [Deltaproteobacteria bacterium]